MLKQQQGALRRKNGSQPPSGGCVLKLLELNCTIFHIRPAAFGRLRVETDFLSYPDTWPSPAAFGRLRVETHYQVPTGNNRRPAAFGRLRVETR